MNEFRFRSLEELYQKLLPALYAKKCELLRHNINFIKEVDIWDYLKSFYWSKTSNLTLSDMVDDILSLSNQKLVEYKESILNDTVKK